MTVIIQFEGIATLPTFNDPDAFFGTVLKLVTENRYLVLNDNKENHFDATKDDTALAIDISKPVSSDITMLINFIKQNLSLVELLSDKVTDTASGAKRRTIMISVS